MSKSQERIPTWGKLPLVDLQGKRRASLPGRQGEEKLGRGMRRPPVSVSERNVKGLPSPKDIHVLIPRTCEYIVLCGKEELSLLMLWIEEKGDFPDLSAVPKVITRVLKVEERGWRQDQSDVCEEDTACSCCPGRRREERDKVQTYRWIPEARKGKDMAYAPQPPERSTALLTS